MRPLIALIIILLVACAQPGPSGQFVPVFEARTAFVYDGDSFLVKRGRNEIEVRLYGIDAPEKSQPWSAPAKKGLESLIDKQMLRVETLERDRYDRHVARVYRVSDDLYINAEMLRQGHAWVYRSYTDERTLIQSEQKARRNGAGLWRLPASRRIPPWQWRKEHKK